MKTTLLSKLDANGGVLVRRDNLDLARDIDYALRRGNLTALLRGVYCRPEDADRFDVRARAVACADPQAVLTGASAARLHGWDEIALPLTVTAASRSLRSRPGFTFRQRRVPLTLIRRVDNIPITSRALTALDLVEDYGGSILDSALRRRVTLDALWQAFYLAGLRRGDALRHRLLDDSRTIPWSEAERDSHHHLRTIELPAWRANRSVYTPHGELVAICDIAVVSLALDIEIDGDEYHAHPDDRARDRVRDRRLAQLGWQVVRFTAREVRDDPGAFLAIVASIVRSRERQLARVRRPRRVAV